MYIGVDGCSAGWVAVQFDESGYEDTNFYEDFQNLWIAHGDATEQILIDVPIGLRENSNAKRPCDDAARTKLSPKRQSSVFPVPVRAAVHEGSYEDAKETQEKRTDGSLGVQSWGIADKIAELDSFLCETEPDAVGTIRESHPEVCFWALNGESATEYSKTGQPAAAFWERIETLEAIDDAIIDDVRDAATGLDSDVGNDDIIDAFALALTASPKTGPLHTLPDEWPEDDEGDPTNKLPMEMVYAYP
jgi:predicted RNase H-like nuclease